MRVQVYGEERVTRRAFIRSRCDNDPRPFNDLPKAYWHGTVLPYGVSEIIFKHDNNILVCFPGPRHRGRPRTPCAAGRGYLTRIITNALAPRAHTCTSTPLDFRCVFHRRFATADFSTAKRAARRGICEFFFSSFTSASRSHTFVLACDASP